MNPIENVYQLRAEIARLKASADIQEAAIKKNLLETAESLSPKNILWTAVSAVTGVKVKGNDMLSRSLEKAVSYISQRYVLKAEKQAESKIYSAIDGLFNRVRNFVNKHTGPEAKREERQEA